MFSPMPIVLICINAHITAIKVAAISRAENLTMKFRIVKRIQGVIQKLGSKMNNIPVFISYLKKNIVNTPLIIVTSCSKKLVCFVCVV